MFLMFLSSLRYLLTPVFPIYRNASTCWVPSFRVFYVVFFVTAVLVYNTRKHSCKFPQADETLCTSSWFRLYPYVKRGILLSSCLLASSVLLTKIPAHWSCPFLFIYVPAAGRFSVSFHCTKLKQSRCPLSTTLHLDLLFTGLSF